MADIKACREMSRCFSAVIMRWLLLLCQTVNLLPAYSWAKAVSADSVQDNHVTNQHDSANQLIGSCNTAPSLTSCLKMRSLMLLDDLVHKETPIHIFGNLVLLVKNNEKSGRMLPTTMDDFDSSLPKDEHSREETLDQLISHSVVKFIKTRSLQIRLPDFSNWHIWNNIEEGRKKKGGLGAGWALMTAGGMMGALGLGSIAMLAGKALMVSMMALMLSALAALKKGGGGGDEHAATTYEVINVPTGHGHHGRSLGTTHGEYMTGAELAYRAHLPAPQASEDNATVVEPLAEE